MFISDLSYYQNIESIEQKIVGGFSHECQKKRYPELTTDINVWMERHAIAFYCKLEKQREEWMMIAADVQGQHMSAAT
ncbi:MULTISPECIES: hypothetical protein [unclassified Moorena]|uniref:hypothetical protein n=1 Tax=unclassified Moorena TaxID=2683338 RepID=UPI0014018882|nr:MULTISPECIES: hypothetical protein [unclassified Moorena]NEO17061.1 hypothetical protein [Moorena sp. SIO3E8]NEQ03637.1 hypothetical protein [Moorena sp. SIO3F7]